MNNLKKSPEYSFSLAGGAIAFVACRWFAYLIKGMGYLPYQGFGIFMFFGMVIVFVLLVMLVDYLLSRIGVNKPIRSGIWAGAMLGPVAGLSAYSGWNNPVLGEATGFICTVLAFVIGYFMEELPQRRKNRSITADKRV